MPPLPPPKRSRLHEVGGRASRAGGRPTEPKGWTNKVAVEAFVVALRDAAAPAKRGLLQPLLQRWQARRCSYAVFGLPAVQAAITFK